LIKALAAFLLPLGFYHHGVIAGEENKTGSVKTNLEVMQVLAQNITEQIISASNISKNEKVLVDVKNGDESWIAVHAFTSSLKDMGFQVFVSSDSTVNDGITLKLPTTKFHVQYDDMFRAGIFGAKKVRRTVMAEVICQAIKNASREILFSKSFSEHSIDTVSVDDISTIEYSAARSTHGELPAEDFLDRIVEPFIIIGATGVVIYLFFHVRS
jgi:hypothetical protein